MVKMRNSYEVLVGKHEGKRLLRISNTFKVSIGKTDGDTIWKAGAFANAKMELRFP